MINNYQNTSIVIHGSRVYNTKEVLKALEKRVRCELSTSSCTPTIEIQGSVRTLVEMVIV